MQVVELENLVRKARGIDPESALDPAEAWDSLDHIAVLDALQTRLGDSFGEVDLSQANSLGKLEELLCE